MAMIRYLSWIYLGLTSFLLIHHGGAASLLPTIPCSNVMCMGKLDGNYEYNNPDIHKDSYYVQCSGGIANCQTCYPLTLKFVDKCNQCLHEKTDSCYKTKPWMPEERYSCPDLCPVRGPKFSGLIADPYNTRHYVACAKGKTAGCNICPLGLVFDENIMTCKLSNEEDIPNVHYIKFESNK